MPIYTVRIYKNFGTSSPSGGWQNTHEMQTDAALDSIEMLNHVTALANFEKRFHLPSVQFQRAVVSLQDDEKDGYRPDEMRAIDISGAGTQAVAAGIDPIDLNMALEIKRFMVLGRVGHIYFRGCLHEGQVGANQAGETVLNADARAALTTVVTDAMQDYAAAGRIMVVRHTHKKTNTTFTRQVNGLQVGDVVMLKRNHRWFNRKKPAGEGEGGFTPPDEV